MANNESLESMIAADGRTVPTENNIDFDSYLDSIPDEMKETFRKMREASKEKTEKAEKELGISNKPQTKSEKEDSGFTEVVMDEAYLRKMKMEKAGAEANRLAKKEAQTEEIDDAIAEEKARLKELEEHPENDPNIGAVQHMTKDGMEDKEVEAKESDVGEVLGEDYSQKNTSTDDDMDFDDLKTDEFLPDLEDDEEDSAEKKKEETPEENTNDDLDEDTPELELRYRREDELEKIIRETKETVVDPDPAPLVHVVQKKTEIIDVPGNNADRVKELSDDVFLTRLNKIRRKNFRVVEVPLINSGFTVTMNGISPGDLIAFYNIVEQRANGAISTIDYLNAQMKTIAKAIIKIHPHFDKSNLHYMIHYADLNMLMYAVVAATLDDAKYPVGACDECGKPFRITVPSTDIILNKDDIADRVEAIYNAKDIKETSLLERNTLMKFPSGFEVVLSHASIADQRSLLMAIDRYEDNATLTEVDKFAMLDAATTELPWIKSLVGPGNIKAKGPFQITKMLGLMEDDERRQIVEAIRKMQKDLLPIKLGVKNVKCPYCGHVHETIPIDSLSALVFYHRRVSTASATAKRD